MKAVIGLGNPEEKYAKTPFLFLLASYSRNEANKWAIDNLRYIDKREKKNYFSKSSSAASAVFRTMLSETDRSWQVITLAQESNKAIGTVSNVKAFLRDRDWINDTSRGEFKLQNIKMYIK